MGCEGTQPPLYGPNMTLYTGLSAMSFSTILAPYSLAMRFIFASSAVGLTPYFGARKSAMRRRKREAAT